MTDEQELREKMSQALCQSGKFETGEGCCAPRCMELLGSSRSRPHGCRFAHEVLGELADRAIALCREHYGAGIKLANIAHGMWSSAEDELEAAKAEIALRTREKENYYQLADTLERKLQKHKAEIARLTRERDEARSEAVGHASEFAAMLVGREYYLAEQRGLDRAAALAEQRGHVTTADAIRALTPEQDDD